MGACPAIWRGVPIIWDIARLKIEMVKCCIKKEWQQKSNTRKKSRERLSQERSIHMKKEENTEFPDREVEVSTGEAIALMANEFERVAKEQGLDIDKKECTYTAVFDNATITVDSNQGMINVLIADGIPLCIRRAVNVYTEKADPQIKRNAKAMAEKMRSQWAVLSRGDVCQKCKFDTGRYGVASDFCPHCGSPMTDHAVEILAERLAQEL